MALTIQRKWRQQFGVSLDVDPNGIELRFATPSTAEFSTIQISDADSLSASQQQRTTTAPRGDVAASILDALDRIRDAADLEDIRQLPQIPRTNSCLSLIHI